MMLSWPLTAPAWPPETGASTKPMPPDLHLACSSRATTADAVVWSTRIGALPDPGDRALIAERNGPHVVVVADAHHHEVAPEAASRG
jgi:hypothetical protein